MTSICHALHELTLHSNDELIGVNQSAWSYFMGQLSKLYDYVSNLIKNMSWKIIVEAGPVPVLLEEIYSLLQKSLNATSVYFVSAMNKILSLVHTVWDYIASLFSTIEDSNVQAARDETFNFESIFHSTVTHFVTIGKHIAKGLLLVVTSLKHSIWYATQMMSSYFVMLIECGYNANVAQFKNNVTHTVCTMACGFMEIMSMTEKQTFIEEKTKLLYVYFQKSIESYIPDMSFVIDNQRIANAVKEHWLFTTDMPAISWLVTGFGWLVKTMRVVFTSLYAWMTCVFQAMFTLITNIVSVHIESYITSDDDGIRSTNQTALFEERCQLLKQMVEKLDGDSQTSVRETLDTIDFIGTKLTENADMRSTQRTQLNMDSIVNEWSERAILMSQIHLNMKVDTKRVILTLEKLYGYSRLDDAVYMAAGMNKLVADQVIAGADELSQLYETKLRDLLQDFDETANAIKDSAFIKPRSVNAGGDEENIDDLIESLREAKEKKEFAELELERQRPIIEELVAQSRNESEVIHQLKYEELVGKISNATQKSQQLQLSFNSVEANQLLVAKEEMKTTKAVTYYSDLELRKAYYYPLQQEIERWTQEIKRIEKAIGKRETAILKKTIVGSAVFVALLGGLVYFSFPIIVEPIKEAIAWIMKAPETPVGFVQNASSLAKRAWNSLTGTVEVNDLKPMGALAKALTGDAVGIIFLFETWRNGRRIAMFLTKLLFNGWKGTVALFQGESIQYSFRDFVSTTREAEQLEQGVLKSAMSMTGIFKQRRAAAITGSVNAVAGIVSAINPIAGVTARGAAAVIERSVNQPQDLNYDNYFGNPNVDPQMAYGSIAQMEQRRQAIAERQQQVVADLQQQRQTMENNVIIAQHARNEVQNNGGSTRSALAVIVAKQEQRNVDRVNTGELRVYGAPDLVDPKKDVKLSKPRPREIIKRNP